MQAKVDPIVTLHQHALQIPGRSIAEICYSKSRIYYEIAKILRNLTPKDQEKLMKMMAIYMDINSDG